jgi:membrane protein
VQRRLSDATDKAEERLPASVVDVVERLRDADVLLYAGALAFYALVSTAPFLVVGFWVMGTVVGDDRVEDLSEGLAELAPENVDLEGMFQTLLEVGTGVGIAALFAALWPATAFGGGLVRVLDNLSLDRDPAMHGLRGRARSLVVLAVLPVYLLGGLIVASLVAGLFGDGPAGTVAGWALALVAGAAATWVGIIGLYWWFGPAELTFRSLAEGAAVAAAMIAVMSLGYLLYLGQGAEWEERVAGSGLAAVVLFGLWLYLANLLLLTGYCVALAVDEGEHRPEAT